MRNPHNQLSSSSVGLSPMAASKLLLFSIFLTLIFTKIPSHAESDDDDDDLKRQLSDPFLKIELDQLKSKVSLLESSIDEKIRKLESKDESIKQMESIIQEKSAAIASFQSNIQALQQKGSLDAKEQVRRAHGRVGELENQVDNLRKEIETQNNKRDALVAQASVAEKKVLELNSKLESLQRINDEQKTRIRKTERALQLAEEEMMKAKLEATTVSKKLIEVREAWVPHWLAVHLLHCQSFIVTHWKEHGRPALDLTFQKALQKKTQVEKWAEPHIERVKTEWIPIMKDQWLRFVAQIGPHAKSLTAKTVEVYHASKKSVEPHVVKVQEMLDPHFQEVKKFTKPYVDQVATVTKPHVDKARVFLKPYTKKVIGTYRKFIKAVTMYHRQVQTTIREKLKNHELAKPLATNELVWFMASVLMALPIIFLSKVASAIFCKKPKKRTHNSNRSHTRRRAKRVHPDQ